jgi:hypothetical protein
MRTIEIHVPCDCSVSTFWNLRTDSKWEEYCAACDDQRFVMVRTDRVEDPAVGTCIRRTSFLERTWPRSLHAVFDILRVNPAELQVQYDMFWSTELGDEHHPCTVEITIPAVQGRFSCRGRLWATPIDEQSCMLSSSYEICVNVPFAARIERSLEQSIATAYRDIPRRVTTYLREYESRPPSIFRVFPRRAIQTIPGSIHVSPILTSH